MALTGDYYNSNLIWTTGTMTGVTTYPIMTTTAAGPVVSEPKPKKRTAVDWLDAEVERMCAVARDALVSA